MKIITYSDPRNIMNIDGWDEIRKYPHFCVSQTLVQGLSHKCGRDSFTVLSTIDKLLNEFYSEWKNNSQLSIKQYIDLTEAIKKIENKRIRNVFYKNKNEVLNSLRLLIEADVGLDDLVEDSVNEEYLTLKKIFRDLKDTNNWNFLSYSKDKDDEVLKLAFEKIIINDLKDELEVIYKIKNIQLEELAEITTMEEAKTKYFEVEPLIKSETKKKFGESKRAREDINSKYRIEKYIDFSKKLTEYKVDKIVLHGIHQFTPLILRLINQLESMGIEVIFLLQYNENFKEIYKTWKCVYEWTNESFIINQVDSGGYSKQIAKDYGNLLLGNLNEISDLDYECIKFDNLTEFTNYVAEIYEESKFELEKKKSGKGKEISVNKSSILAGMSQQFYSVNGAEVNQLLSVYFPEQFGEKHFLSYPIGQFILGLYSMWNYDEQKIVVNNDVLRECLAVNLWGKNVDTTPLELHEKIRSYLLGIEDIDVYIKNINLLIRYKEALNKPQWIIEKENYEMLSFFSLDLRELELYKYIIIDLKYIAKTLFSGQSNVTLKDHYKKLMILLKERAEINNNISKEELDFVKELFDKLDHDSGDIKSGIEEVKNTLHYYLSIKNDDDSSSWIVRDFQQIDGAIFLADENAIESHSNQKRSVYHYAEISDSNINTPKQVKLPWPLKDNYFKNSNEIINIAFASKREFANFLKCTLFYGMYYLNRDLKISYIENVDSDKKSTLYFPLRLLNMKEESYTTGVALSIRERNRKEHRLAEELIKENEISKEEARMMSFCPYRYFYEGLIDIKGTYSSDFLSKIYIKTIFTLKVVKQLIKENIIDNQQEKLRIIDERINKGKRLIPAWERDFQDIKASIISFCSNFTYRTIEDDYIDIRRNYINMKFVDLKEKREFLVEKCNSNYELNKNIQRIKDYIKYDKLDDAQKETMEEKCKYCKYREICIHVYRDEGEI